MTRAVSAQPYNGQQYLLSFWFLKGNTPFCVIDSFYQMEICFLDNIVSGVCFGKSIAQTAVHLLSPDPAATICTFRRALRKRFHVASWNSHRYLSFSAKYSPQQYKNTFDEAVLGSCGGFGFVWARPHGIGWTNEYFFFFYTLTENKVPLATVCLAQPHKLPRRKCLSCWWRL